MFNPEANSPMEPKLTAPKRFVSFCCDHLHGYSPCSQGKLS